MAHGMEISSLINDVQLLLSKGDAWDQATTEGLYKAITTRLRASGRSAQRKPQLRLSKMGPTCPKALWHSIHTPELEEPLPPAAVFKYTYGHIIEALAICLARRTGHDVVGEQDEIVLDGVTGHRDMVCDGCIVDVKSCSSLAFQKFKNKTLAQDDQFGYLDQLDGYVVGSMDDPLVTNKDTGYLWAIDKTLGKMCLYEHKVRPESIANRIALFKRIIERSTPPACECGTRPDGQSGNISLDTRASYSSFKFCCHPTLRTFIYSTGPRYLTKVVRLPDVIEVDRHGKVVYN